MFETSPIESAVVRVLKAEAIVPKRIEFETFGADRKAKVRCGIEGRDALFEIIPSKDGIQVALQLLECRTVEELSSSELTRRGNIANTPEKMVEVAKKAHQARPHSLSA